MTLTVGGAGPGARTGIVGLMAVLVGGLLAILATGVAPVSAQSEALEVVPVTTQLWVGEGRLILAAFDPDGQPLVTPDAQASLVLVAPDGTSRAPVTPTVARWSPDGRELYTVRATLDQVGTWTATLSLALDGGVRTGTTTLDVRPDDGTPALGSLVPDVVTPTMRDAGNVMRSISSDPEPITDFYIASASELLAAGRPFVLVFDSYLFRPNEACGGVLGILHEIGAQYPDLAVVHAEPWVTSYLGGTLALDPAEGPARLTDAALAYGLVEPPWAFVVDRDGRLYAKFSGVVGTDELRAAMDGVAAR